MGSFHYTGKNSKKLWRKTQIKQSVVLKKNRHEIESVLQSLLGDHLEQTVVLNAHEGIRRKNGYVEDFD